MASLGLPLRCHRNTPKLPQGLRQAQDRRVDAKARYLFQYEGQTEALGISQQRLQHVVQISRGYDSGHPGWGPPSSLPPQVTTV